MTITQAAVRRGPELSFVIETVVLDDPAPHEVVVRIVASGMCHTDMWHYDSTTGLPLPPIVLGHEGSGVVEQVGNAVSTVAVGDHVVLSFSSCGECRSCRADAPAYCREFDYRNLTGRYVDGSVGARDTAGEPVANRWFGQSSFAHHSIVAERDLVVVRPDLPLELLGPLGCGIQTGAGAVLNEMALAPGQSIAIFGAGAVGLAAVMAARVAGAGQIIVVDVHQERLDLALELGATRVVAGGEGSVAQEVRGAGEGVDFSFDTTGIGAVMSDAIAVLAVPGSAVLVAGGPGRLDVEPYVLAGRRVTFVLMGSSVPQVFVPRLIDLWQQGMFPFEKLVRTYPLEQVNAAESDSLAARTVKPVLLMG